MDLEQALRDRRSIRAYRPGPVPRELLRKIMEAAIQVPSSGNVQPWSFEIVGGKVLDQLREAMSEMTRSGAKAYPDVPRYVASGKYLERRREVLGKMYDALGISRGEDDQRLYWHMNMDRFFDAPNLIVVCVERSLSPWTLMDIGAIGCAMTLLAHSHGLGTCIMGRAANYPDILREHLRIPDSKLVVIGMAIGYPNPDAAVNKFRAGREPLDSFVTWHGM